MSSTKSLHNVSLKISEDRLESIYSEKVRSFQYRQTLLILVAKLILVFIWVLKFAFCESYKEMSISIFFALILCVTLLLRPKFKIAVIYLTKFYIFLLMGVVYYKLRIQLNEELAIFSVRSFGFLTLIMDWFINRWIIKAVIFLISQTFFIILIWDEKYKFEMVNQIAFEIICTLIFYWSEKARKQNFLEVNQKIQQLSLHHDIINKLIPSSMIILQFKSPKDYKILYANDSCLKKFNISSEKELYKILTLLRVDQEEIEVDKRESCNILEDAFDLLCNKSSDNRPTQSSDRCKEIDIMDVVSSSKLFAYKESYYNAKYSHCYFQSELSALIFLSDETIQRKNEYLQQMNVYKDKLLARISHDLKTPLHCIQSISSNYKKAADEENQLDKTISDDTVYDDMDSISKNSQLLMYMINDILDYSSIKMNKLKLECSLFKVKNAVLEIFDLLKTQVSSQNVQLIADVCNSLEIYNDLNRFKQVLLNFITNSIRHTPSGYVKVQIKAISETNELQISIKDSGVGMSQQTISSLFSQIGTFNKTHLNVNGIGLGLIMCKKLIKEMGSNDYISVESKPDQGSKFIFRVKQRVYPKIQLMTPTLHSAANSAFVRTRATTGLSSNYQEKNDTPEYLTPKHDSNEKSSGGIIEQELNQSCDMGISIEINPRSRALTEFKTHSFQPSLVEEVKKLKVMIVDDVQYNIIALKAHLRKFKNFEISEFIFAEEALNDIQKTQYDIIFSDVQMPILDGIQFIKKVRDLKDQIKQPIVFMISADNQQQHQDQLSGLDIQSFIQKPILNSEHFMNLVSASIQSIKTQLI